MDKNNGDRNGKAPPSETPWPVRPREGDPSAPKPEAGARAPAARRPTQPLSVPSRQATAPGVSKVAPGRPQQGGKPPRGNRPAGASGGRGRSIPTGVRQAFSDEMVYRAVTGQDPPARRTDGSAAGDGSARPARGAPDPRQATHLGQGLKVGPGGDTIADGEAASLQPAPLAPAPQDASAVSSTVPDPPRAEDPPFYPTTSWGGSAPRRGDAEVERDPERLLFHPLRRHVPVPADDATVEMDLDPDHPAFSARDGEVGDAPDSDGSGLARPTDEPGQASGDPDHEPQGGKDHDDAEDPAYQPMVVENTAVWQGTSTPAGFRGRIPDSGGLPPNRDATLEWGNPSGHDEFCKEEALTPLVRDLPTGPSLSREGQLVYHREAVEEDLYGGYPQHDVEGFSREGPPTPAGMGMPLLLEAPPRIRVESALAVSPDERLVIMTRPATAAAEQYRMMALKLKDRANVRVVAVMAPDAQEEAEVVAANLSLALAEGHRSKVCLVDGNLRDGPAAGLFGLEAVDPLDAQIHGHRLAPEGPWNVIGLGPALHVLPSRSGAQNPSELLNSEAVWELFDALRRRFDYVVVTSPPLLQSADGVILQDHSDGVILVARANRTRADALRGCIARLGQWKVLGSVLLDARLR